MTSDKRLATFKDFPKRFPMKLPEISKIGRPTKQIDPIRHAQSCFKKDAKHPGKLANKIPKPELFFRNFSGGWISLFSPQEATKKPAVRKGRHKSCKLLAKPSDIQVWIENVKMAIWSTST